MQSGVSNDTLTQFYSQMASSRVAERVKCTTATQEGNVSSKVSGALRLLSLGNANTAHVAFNCIT